MKVLNILVMQELFRYYLHYLLLLLYYIIPNYSKIVFSKSFLIVPLLFLIDPYADSVINCAMEQSMFIFFGITGLIFINLANKKDKDIYYLLSALFFALQFITRPEGIIFISVSVLFLLYRKNIKGAAIISLFYILFVMPFLLMFFNHFGSPLPITMFVKTTDPKGHLPF